MEMKRMTFKQFIYTYCFRHVNDFRDDEAQFDTTIIRIYPPVDNYERHRWFEFGVYDFSEDEYKWSICEQVLSKEILNSFVSEIEYNSERENVVHVYLDKKEKDI